MQQDFFEKFLGSACHGRWAVYCVFLAGKMSVMITAKEFGKNAKVKGINAPTLDENFLHWLTTIDAENKIDIFVQWWEGWYEALDEHLSFRNKKYH
jgi:hypothetical protein